jgi:predicted oxidoreductase
VDADAIVVGAGLAGLVATAELADAGRRVLLLDQENEANLGGQAFWSLGGLFLVDSPEQRRMGVHDSLDLAWQDWEGTAGFDRDREDRWPRQWARAYVEWAAGEKRSWLHAQGMRWFPVVGWAERGGYDAEGPGNSVPRFHVTWGTGPGVMEPFARRVGEHVAAGRVTVRHRHQVDALTVTGGAVDGVRGTLLEPSTLGRGFSSSRAAVGDFELHAQAVVVTSGGIGGNHDLVKAAWPQRLGTYPEGMLTGVPAHVDGRMLAITESAGASIVNRDRMWHYTEGVANWDPIWPGHGIRILPGPVVAVAGRDGPPAAGAVVPRLRHPRHPRPHPGHRACPHLVRADPEDHREGVRALGVGAEPGPDRSRRAPGARPDQARRAGAGRGLQAARRGLRGP